MQHSRSALRGGGEPGGWEGCHLKTVQQFRPCCSLRGCIKLGVNQIRSIPETQMALVGTVSFAHLNVLGICSHKGVPHSQSGTCCIPFIACLTEIGLCFETLAHVCPK